MSVKEFLSNALKKDGRFKELEKEMRIQKMVEERMKSSDERELEGFYKAEREKEIKRNLEEFRKKQQEETWHGDTILNAPNIFKGGKSIMDNDHSVLDNGKSMLHDKKLFKVGKAKSKKKGGMFFK